MAQQVFFHDDLAIPGGRIPHPIPYQGSKRNLASKILAYFPAEPKRLVEPFAGSAAISLASAYHGLAKSFWINDAHLPLISLWREILDDADGLCSRYERLWREQAGR